MINDTKARFCPVQKNFSTLTWKRLSRNVLS